MLLRENVYEKLRADILSCQLAPGDDMREQELAERYAVSRQPVREALLRLEREHLVTVQPRQGYRVNPISLADARDLLRFRLATIDLLLDPDDPFLGILRLLVLLTGRFAERDFLVFRIVYDREKGGQFIARFAGRLAFLMGNRQPSLG